MVRMISRGGFCLNGLRINSVTRSDGEGREYFDGCALIILNGEVVAQASQFSLNDV